MAFGTIGKAGLGLLVAALAAHATMAAPGKPDFFDGLRAYDARDIDTALDEWTKAARAGDLRSQKQLADMYRDGRRVPQNFAQAYQWYALAATNMAVTADAGRKATGELLPSFDALKAEAQTEAARVRAWLTQADLNDAHRAVEDAYAARGAQGLFELGKLFEDGKVLPANKVEALRYYVIAAFQGSEEALKARDGLIPKLQAPQIVAGQRAAAEWLRARGIKTALPEPAAARVEPPKPPAAKPAQPPAPPKPPETPVAEKGPDKPGAPKAETPKPAEPPGVKPFVPPPGREAPLPPEIAEGMAPAGAPAANFLSPRRGSVVALADQRTDTKIVQQALKVLGFYTGRINGDANRATTRAIQGFQRTLGATRTGQLTVAQFERLLQRAAQDKDNAITQFHFARVLLAGRYIQRDTDRAVRLFNRSAEQGIAEAAFTLGVMYRDGVGVPKDPALAAVKFKQAERLGHDKAGEALKQLRQA